jgi:DNA-binding IclR family transcriptional regulator
MKSLHKVLDIIDTVAEVGSVGIRELSAITGFPPATTHRIVSTLIKRRYFKQNPVTKSYSLSLRFLELGQKVQQHFNLSSHARPHLERLMGDTQENVNIAVQDGDEAVYLDQIRCNHMLQLFTKLGARVPLYSTGVGKMFLSQWLPEAMEAYLKRTPLTPHTPHTLVSRERLLEELERVRLRGYSVDNEEMEEGVRCVAALVHDHRGAPVAAVSISGAAMRLTSDRIEQFSRQVKNCASLLSQELGFNPAAQSRSPS